jgi:hypothetical protein
MVLSGALSAGSLVVFILYLGKMYKPMQQLSKMTDAYSKAVVGYELPERAEISDPAILRLLNARAQAGVGIKAIGRVNRAGSKLDVRKLSIMRLHTRTIIRDGKQAFIGSQSLREMELGSSATRKSSARLAGFS